MLYQIKQQTNAKFDLSITLYIYLETRWVSQIFIVQQLGGQMKIIWTLSRDYI